MAAIASLTKKKYDEIEDKTQKMNSCPICLEEYKEDDNIAELQCDKRHFFHERCIDDWLKKKQECPLCKKPVK
jgi:hypothetical protein